jgi:cell wall-associated NlpC family hydrolase
MLKSTAFKYNPFTYNPIFPQDIIDEAIVHAIEEWPNESCGAIINGAYERFENKASDTSKTFLIDDKHFYRSYINEEVEAVIHSHDDYAMASKQDQIQQNELQIPFGIINLLKKCVTHVMFWGDSLPIAPLKERFWFYGNFDCFGLVRDHIRLTHGVTPPNPPRDFAFWYKGVSMFEEFVHEERFPFKYIDLEDIQPGDYVLYNINGTKYCNHIGVVESPNRIIHHLYNKISRSFPYTHDRQWLQSAVRYDHDWPGWEDQDVWRKGEQTLNRSVIKEAI